MTLPPTVRWIVLALLGLAVAAAVSVAASRLVSQRIGLASEPLSAGKELAPPKPSEGQGGGRPSQHQTDQSGSIPAPATTTTTTTTVVPPTTTPAPPSGGATSGAPGSPSNGPAGTESGGSAGGDD